MGGRVRDANSKPLEHLLQPTTIQREPRGQVPLILFLTPWLFVVAIGIKVKLTLLGASGGGYDFLAELQGLHNANAIGLAQRFALLRGDLLVPGLIGSLLLLGGLRILPPSFRAPFAGLLSATLILILYVELKCYWEVGTFLPASVIGSGILGAGRELITQYATSATLWRLVLALVVVAASTVYLASMSRPGRADRVPRSAIWACHSLGIALVVLTLAAWAIPVRRTPYDRSAFRAALMAFAGQDARPAPSRALAGSLTADSLLHLYRTIAAAPLPNARSRYFGAAKGYDVLVFLFESLPWACYSSNAGRQSLPNFHFLESRGFVARSHHATYPYSRRAYTSIYTSWYPLNGIRGIIAQYEHEGSLSAPGMVRAANLAGYETATFVPERPQAYEDDSTRYGAVGFHDYVVPPSALSYTPSAQDSADGNREWHRVRDHESLKQLEGRMLRAIQHDQRYLFAFNPQLSHGPWPNVADKRELKSVCHEGLTLFSEVDTMLGELVALLREQGRLSHTLIVALGDHGLRTREEFPSLRVGTLDDITFHVPLVIWAPGVVDTTTAIAWVTSHIDIAPSVLDLLGLTKARDLELGSPLWDPRLVRRKTYFFARSYLGADGFSRGNEAVMLKYLFGGVSRSRFDGELHFDAKDMLVADDSLSFEVARELNDISRIQLALGRTMILDEGFPGDASRRPQHH